MKQLKLALMYLITITILSSCASVGYNQGMTFEDRGITCKNVQYELKNNSDYDLKFTIDDSLFVIAPHEKIKPILPINIDNDYVSVISCRDFTEEIKIYPGMGYELTPWIDHCLECNPLK